MGKYDMPGEEWDEITYPFPKFNGRTVEVWECISNFLTTLRLKLIHVSKEP